MDILFDSNVIIDAISERDDSNVSATISFFEAIDGRIVKGFLTSKQITDIFYVLRKYVKEKEVREDFIKLLLKAFNIIEINQIDLIESFSIRGKDYEDDLLSYTAKKHKLDYIVTNNKKDFLNSKVEVISPNELVNMIKKEKDKNPIEEPKYYREESLQFAL